MKITLGYKILAIIGLIVSSSYGDLVRTVHFFSPWETAPQIIIKSYSADETRGTSMVKDPNSCGWYSYTGKSHQDFTSILFTDGSGKFYGQNGKDDGTTMNLVQGDGFNTSGDPEQIRYVAFNTETSYTLGSWKPDIGFNGECRTLHLFSPWPESVPLIQTETGTTRGMIPDTTNCGWYSTTFSSPHQLNGVLFKNKNGETYGANGKDDITPISIEPLLTSNEEVFFYYNTDDSYKTQTTRIETPTTGTCLIALLKGVIYDWDVGDFGAFEPGHDECQQETGLVQSTLGSDGLPEPSASAENCFATEIKQWFQQSTLDAQSNHSCLDLKLVPNEEGNFEFNQTVAQDDYSGDYGFYPIDDFEHENNSKTNNQQRKHNYHFCMKIETSFTYKKGQKFAFEGDDDMWVYVNKELALDIGGIHGPTPGSINMDDLFDDSDLGKKQDFKIFYCERQTSQSNLKIQTDIDFDAPQVYHNEFDLDKSSDNRRAYVIYEGYFLQQGGCSPIENSVDRRSEFYWSTDDVLDDSDMLLKQGDSYFGGAITIDENRFEFSIDSTEFEDVDEGVYYLFHKSISKGTDESSFIVVNVTNHDYMLRFLDPYDMAIEYSDANPMDTIVLGSMEPGDFIVKIYEIFETGEGIDTVECPDCEGSFSITADGDPFTIEDETFKNGLFSFNVSSIEPIEQLPVTVTFSPNNQSVYPRNKMIKSIVSAEITVLEYPNYNPARNGSFYLDMNSDGTMDRIQLSFKTPPTDSALENMSIAFSWPNQTNAILQPDPGEIKRQSGDSLSAYWTIPADRFTLAPYLTSIVDPQYAVAVVWFQYPWMDTPDNYSITIEDRMPPVLISAWLYPGNAEDTLVVSISETLDMDDIKSDGNEHYEALPRSGGSYTNHEADSSHFDSLDTYYTEHVLYFPVSPENLIKRGDSLKIVDAARRVIDLEGNIPGDSTRSISVQAIVPDITKVSDFLHITEDLLDAFSDTKESNKPVVKPIDMDKDPSNTMVGIQKPGNMKDMLWHLMDEYGWNDQDPSHFTYEFTLTTFSTLGQFVNRIKSSVSCADEEIFGGNCLTMDPEDIQGFVIYTPPFSSDGRLLGSGVYILDLEGEYVYRSGTTDDVISNGTKSEFFKYGVFRD